MRWIWSVKAIVWFAALASLWVRAEPQMKIQPATVRPGDPILITVTGAHPVGGKLGDRALTFYRSDRHDLAVIGLPVEQPLGLIHTQVELEHPLAEAHAPLLDADIQVIEPGFPSRELQVPGQYVEIPPPIQHRIDEDKAAIAKAYAQPPGPPKFSGPFSSPRPLAPFTAPFGDKRVFNGKVQSQHYGVDFEGQVGDPVLAANDGTIVLARDCYLSGNTLVIDHGAQVYTAYFHLSAFEVGLGDQVRKGERIGRVGRSGRVTGPHLHWSVRIGDLYVNGATLLKLQP